MKAQEEANQSRYRPGRRAGFYESFFLRANHPTRPLAFWIRYTIFSPAGRPEAAQGELWALYFDGETGAHAAAKAEVPMAECAFSATSFAVRVGGAELGPGRLAGAVAGRDQGQGIGWDLTFSGSEAPLFLLPLPLYRAPLPKAKSLVGLPMAVFQGELRVGDRRIEIGGWTGSQNHNWGSKHTDLYAWGQVAGFDGHPESFLEAATARLRIGPFWTPPMTPLVLRHRGEELALNSLGQTLRAHGTFVFFDWTFRSETERLRVEGRVRAPREAFVALAYRNPPGGIKQCLNSKIASCELRLSWKQGPRAGTSEVLSTAHRAAFEILTDDEDHGVALRA